MSLPPDVSPWPGRGWLAKERILASPRYNRWWAPPAALAIHLSIGMAYGFSVFWLPMSQLLGSPGITCPPSLMAELFSRDCNWSVAACSFTFTLFIVFLGLSSALWGQWVERAGPRASGLLAAVCWSGGIALGALGVYLHQLWIVWLGTGVLGGVGLGIGYITPVSTLIRWFPDRRGMATGLAIMGFGGGAMIGAPLAAALLQIFSKGGRGGVWETFLALSLLYFVVMAGGALSFRLPPPGWQPTTKTQNRQQSLFPAKEGYVPLETACKTRAFWLLWTVLCVNVSAGIGVLAMASPLLQEVFGGKLMGKPLPFDALSSAEKAKLAATAASLVGLLSLLNSLGRIFWASLSDRIGRRATYSLFFVLGAFCYTTLPSLGHAGRLGPFLALLCLVISLYGGGFATIPAYLADLFGTQKVGAIHGRLLTAWSVAGIVGPVLVTKVRETALASGLPRSLAYDRVLYLLGLLLLLGLLCNSLVRPLPDSLFLQSEPEGHPPVKNPVQQEALKAHGNPTQAPFGWIGFLAWLAVGLPFLTGLYLALEKAASILRRSF